VLQPAAGSLLDLPPPTPTPEGGRPLSEAPDQLARADLLLTRIDQVDVTRSVLEAASRLPDPGLRSPDAIHLATALQLAGDLEALVTYDGRLAAAAGRQKLPVVTP
jgi:uncharacterized protein